MSIAYVCIASLALLIFGLGFYVSILRGAQGELFGTPTDIESKLYKTIRAHANAVEYGPISAVLIYVLAQAEQLSTWVIVSIIALTVCRYLNALGLILQPSKDKPHVLRVIGGMSTYILGLVLSVKLLADFI